MSNENAPNGGPQNGGPNATPKNAGDAKPGAEPSANQTPDAPDMSAETAKKNLDELADAMLKDPLLVAEADVRRLEEEVQELKAQLTRSHADIQNMHRRHEKEQAEMAQYAIRKFAKDIVGVADNFARAAQSIKPEDAETPAVKGLLEGVDMTEREFMNVLEKHGVQRIEPLGEPFDPHKHQAMMEQEDPSKPSGTVLQVFQSGYEIGEQVLRPAMVIVSRGGPKIKKAEPAAAPKEEEKKPRRTTLRMPHDDEDNDGYDEDDDDGAPPPIDQM